MLLQRAELHAGTATLTPDSVKQFYFDWPIWARNEQLPPDGDWTTWLLIGGRGSGKTRAGAEWVRALAQAGVTPIALVGETMTEAIAVMVRGESGLMNIHPKEMQPILRGATLVWPNGVVATILSASDPDRFRGPQFAAAWCDEIGCGAVDKGANQPNMFADPKSAENGRPYFSNGSADPLIQRQFLRAHQRFWRDVANNPSGMVDPDRLYVWCWDARPFPAFPSQLDVWSDGGNHVTGHWLTGRLGGAASDELITAIAADHGVALAGAAAAGPLVQGYQVSNAGTCRDALAPVLKACGLNVRDSADGLVLGGIGQLAAITLDPDGLAQTDKPVLARRRGDPGAAVGRMSLSYTDREHDYLTASLVAMRQGGGALAGEASALVLDPAGARGVAERLLGDLGQTIESIDLALPPSQAALEVGDLIAIAGVAEGPFLVTDLRDGAVRGLGARSVPNPVPIAISGQAPRGASSGAVARALPVVAIAHLPPVPENPGQSRLAVAAFAQPWPGIVTVSDAGTGAQVAQLTRRGGVGELVTGFDAGPLGVWDRSGELSVQMYAGHLASIDPLAALAGGNKIAVQTDGGDWEIVGFADAQLLAPGQYRLTQLLRGQDGTGAAMGPASAGNRVMVLDGRAVIGPADAQWLGGDHDLQIYAGNADLVGTALRVSSCANPVLPLAPVHLAARRVTGTGDIALSWTRCSRADGNGWVAGDAPLELTPERYGITIFDGATATRSSESLTPQWTCTASEQTADFGGLASSLGFEITQISPVYGPGHIASGAWNG